MVAALGACVAFLGCQKSPTPAASTVPVQPSKGFDLSGVMNRVHFAFRPDGPSFKGAHSTYRVEASADGFSFEPKTSASKAVRFEAAEIRSGSTELPRGSKATVNEDGQLVIARDGAIERLQNTPDGVEQSWTFAQKPEGEIVVRLRVDGELVATTANGLHFRAGDSFVRYGNAKWVDNNGVEVKVEAKMEGPDLVLRVPAADVERAAYPAVLDPIVGAEFDIDRPVIGAAPYAQTAPDIQFGGGNYFAVWEDLRSGVSEIYGTRVSPAGVVLDKNGIFIAGNSAGHPRIAWNGTVFYVVWHLAGPFGAYDVYGTRVDPSGNLLDPPGGVVISAGLGAEHAPDVASDGTNFFVVWDSDNGGSSPSRVFGRYVSAAGVPGVQTTGTNGMVRTTSGWGGAESQYGPAIAGGNGVYLVAWESYCGNVPMVSTPFTDLRGARFTATSTFISYLNATSSTNDEPYLVDSSGNYNRQNHPSVAYNPVQNNFFIAFEEWFAQRGSFNQWFIQSDGIYGMHIKPSGATSYWLDTPSFYVKIAHASQTSDDLAPSIVANGSDYFLTFTKAFNFAGGLTGVTIEGTRVSGPPSQSPMLDPALIAIDDVSSCPSCGNVGSASVATSGSNYFAVWEDGRNPGTTSDIYGARVSTASTVDDPNGVLLTYGPNAETNPAAAFDGTNHLVVWEDTRGTDRDLYGAIVNQSGGLQNGSSFAVSTAANRQTTPTVAWNGSNYMVAWTDYRSGSYSGQLYGARVSSSGSVLDPSGLLLVTNNNSLDTPKLVWDGVNTYLAWYGGCGTSYGACGTRLDGTGNSLDDAGVYLGPGGQNLAVASNGSDVLAVWEASSRVSGRHISLANVPDPADTVFTAGPNRELQPTLATNGTDYFLAWQDWRNDPNGDIYGTPIVGGVPLLDGGIPIGAGTGAQQSPTATFNGSSYVVAWTDTRSGSADLWLNYVDPTTGTVADAGGFPTGVTLASELAPLAFSAGNPSRSLLVYSSASRVRGRYLSTASSNSAPTANAQSVSTAEDTPLTVALTGSDPDADPLSFVAAPPAHGTLSINGASVIYTPAANYNGADSFTFKAFDGLAYSPSATVSITVTPVNDAPVANAQSLIALQN
ncbi:MAG: Ig-like domain-containing protein, partial [Myxococcaceae bacterium]